MRFSARPCLVITLVLVAALLGGCERGSAAADPGPTRSRQWPASAAGGACRLLVYDAVAQATGTRFDTAGSGKSGATQTCALTVAGRAYPDLTLAATTTSADEIVFLATVAPSGSTPTRGLGQVGYRLRYPAKGKAGPGIEVCWLSASGKLLVIRYTFAAKTSAATADALAPKLVGLAKKVDKAARA